MQRLFDSKILFFLSILLFASFSFAAPTIDGASANPNTVTVGATITFSATVSGTDLNTFKLYICRNSCTSAPATAEEWCHADENTTATSSQCTLDTTAVILGTRDYHALVCDTLSGGCSSPTNGTFTVNGADTTPPASAVKDVNGDTLAPYWAITDQAVTLTISNGEALAECKWSDSNWGADTFTFKGTVCTTNGNDSACNIGTKAQTTSTSHVVYFNCKDSANNATGGMDVNFGNDYTAPTGSISVSVSGSQTNATFSGADAHSGVQKYEIKVDSGSYTDKGTSTSHTFSGLSNGDHNFTVKITDNAGNFALFSELKNVNSSNSIGKPEIGSRTHYDENKWYSQASVDFNWTSATGATKYRYALDQNSGTIPDANHETNSLTRMYDSMPDGDNYFHVRACNDANECGETDHFRLKIDATAPGPPLDIGFISQSNGSIYMSWTAPSDTSGIAEYVIYRSLQEKRGTRDFLPSDSGVVKFTGITGTSYTDRNNLTTGIAYYYRIQASDNAGNNGSMSAVKQVNNSGSSCTLAFTSNVPQILRSGLFSVNVNIANGDIRNASLKAKYSDGASQLLLDNYAGNSITKDITIPETSGSATIEVAGKDSMGSACSKQFAFSVDVSDPVISTAQVPTSVENGDTITIFASDETGIQKVEAEIIDGARVVELSKNGDNYELEIANFSQGSHKIVIRATDVAGRVSSEEISINVAKSEDVPVEDKNSNVFPRIDLPEEVSPLALVAIIVIVGIAAIIIVGGGALYLHMHLREKKGGFGSAAAREVKTPSEERQDSIRKRKFAKK